MKRLLFTLLAMLFVLPTPAFADVSGEISYSETEKTVYIAGDLSKAGITGGSYVTLLITDKTTGDIKHIKQITVGDLTIHEVVATNKTTVKEIGIPIFDVDNGKKGNVYFIDNVILTKATEVDAIECGDIVINGDASISSLPKSGTVNASVSIKNRGQAKSFTALLVVRNTADDSTVRVYKSSVTDINANSNITVEFPNTDVSGGNCLEVYIWNNLKGLTAYTAGRCFPEN